MNADDDFTGFPDPDRLISPGRPISPGRLISPGRPISPGRLISPGRPISPGRDALDERLISPGRPISPGRLISPGRPISPGRAAELGDLRDPGCWSDAVAILFVESSALLRLGARLAASDVGVRAPFIDRTTPPSWSAAATGVVEDCPVVLADHWLGWALEIEESRLRDALADPALVGALLDEIAEGLVLAADTAFLSGDEPGPDARAPAGVNRIQAVKHVDAAGNALETARAMLAELRTPGSTFRSPGWILDPRLFDELARVELPEGPADSTLLLQGDGADGGMFLGYPYVVSPAAVTGDDGSPAMFFAADWGEAWIAAEPEVVRVRLSAAAAAGATQTQIQVVMRVNFALRRPEFFAVSP